MINKMTNKKIVNNLHNAILNALSAGMSIEDINEIRYREAKPGIRAEQIQKKLKETSVDTKLLIAEMNLCEAISSVTYLACKDDKYGMDGAKALDAIWNASWGKSNLLNKSMILYRVGPRTR